ncbi:hypothetical protein [Dokdonella sp.]|uniref:hypothetical protein n=1 Tax=Dokdonella sp. TaxID=2291710 RepID=UPI003C694D2D
MFRNAVLFLVVLIFFVPQGFAKSRSDTNVVEVDTYENFQGLVVDIREEMVVGGRYEFLKGLDRDNVNRRLDEMAEQLRVSGSIAEVSPGARSELMENQEAVNELLTKFADNRVICTHEAPIGSLIPRKRCRTVRQIEKSRSGSKGQILDMQRDSSLGGE